MATSNAGKVPAGFAKEIALSEISFRTAHRAVESEPASKKRKREAKGDSSLVYGKGAYKGPWARYEEVQPDAVSDEEGVEYVYEEDEIEEQPTAPVTKAGTDYEADGAAKESTDFHGTERLDYMGRTILHVPQELRGEGPDKCYVPKKLIHTWKSHTKSITQMRFFPDSGHLLLSASADSFIKLYDVHHSRELLRTYSAHTKSVADVCFNNDGTRFISASYDRFIKLHDTESGQVISSFTTGKTPHVVRFNPSPSLNHEFLAGMSNKTIVQYDTRSNSLVQEYAHHLSNVNTLTFCDDNRRFISTSDDKSLRAWEYGIPVPIKFIAEPYMYALVRSAAHPSGKYAAFQSSDNQIVVYATTDRFRQNRKKGFRGHNNAGYAIDVAISPDGQIVSSGDTGGYVCFWDWKTCKMWHKIQASDVPVVACQWHPRETSKVVTGDLNGVIKYWD